MKKTSTPRLLIFFATIAITLAVAVTMHSCKKDSTSTKKSDNIATEMKQWLYSQKTDSLISITVDNLVSQVDWQSPHSLTADSGLTYEAALLNTTTSFDDVNKTEKRYLVLTKQNGKITDANIYELFGNKTDLIGKEDKAISNFNKSSIENFTGVITICNWKNSFKQSKTYVNGIIAGYSILTSKPNNGKTAVQSTKRTLSTQCVDWYLDTYYNGVLIDEEYEGTTCPGDTCAQEAFRDHKGVLTVGTNCNGGGGNGSDASVAIVNNVQDSCLYKMVNATINASVTNQINTLVQSVFGGSSKLNISFVDVTSLPNNVDGYTEINGGFSSNGVLNIEIQLNKNTMPSYSQQYIARVIMHEGLHAYLTAKGTLAQLQHEDIITDYVTKMAVSLQGMFPSLTDIDAKNLALGGLQVTDTFKYSVETDMGLSGTFDATQLAYSIGTLGNRCN